MKDTPQIASSVVTATHTTADEITVGPGLYVKLSPSHPFCAQRGALEMIGWINALDNTADMFNGTYTNLGGIGKPESQLTVWVHSSKDQRFRMSCDFVGGECRQPTAFKVWMPDGTEQVFDANAVAFEFTTASPGWHRFGVAAVAPKNLTCSYTFHACEVTYLGPSD
jgi:hypothetical protein